MSEDFYKPVNIRDSIFGDLQLPQQSNIISKKNPYQEQQSSPKENNINININDDFDFDIPNLGEVSKISKHIQKQQNKSTESYNNQIQKTYNQDSENTRPNSASSSKKQKQQAITTIGSLKKAQQRKVPNKKQQKKNFKPSKQVDLDAQIGQYVQWVHRSDEEQSDFDKQDPKQQIKIDKDKNDQMRKKIQQKVKAMQNKTYKTQNKPMGLAAKAQQLRKKNQQQRLKKLENNINQTIHQTSTTNLKSTLNSQQKQPVLKNKIQQKVTTQIKKNIKIPVQQQQQQQSQDPWDKVNEQTKKQYQLKQQKKNSTPLTKEKIIQYYKEEFMFSVQDLQIEFQILNNQEQIVGCWQSLFGCLKSQDDKNNDSKKVDKLMLRLLAISKISVTNTDEQFWVLKFIYQKLTEKQFVRYGNHWNDIGFQGRDPVTDLRSTGFLSLLQWFQFIDQNQKQSKSIYSWTNQHDFPLALTHIKATGLFIQMLKKRKIKAKNWNQYQKNYNCIITNLFKKIKATYNESENVGKIVESNIQQVNKNYNKLIKQYEPNKKN